MKFHIKEYHVTFDQEVMYQTTFKAKLLQHSMLIELLHKHCYLKLVIFEFHNKIPSQTQHHIIYKFK